MHKDINAKPSEVPAITPMQQETFEPKEETYQCDHCDYKTQGLALL